jgi:hypothetical protein
MQPPAEGSGDAAATPWPQHQVYFVTVEWHDEPHQPESPERLAQILRQAIVHAHDHGPQMVPSRFTVRVKAAESAAEVNGTVAHHHHGPPAPPAAQESQ